MPDIEAPAPEKASLNDRAAGSTENENSDLSRSLWQLMETSKSVPFQMADQPTLGNAIQVGDVGFSQNIPGMELFEAPKAKSTGDAVEQKAATPQDAKANLTESLFNPNLSSQEKLSAVKALADMGVTNIAGPDGKQYDIRTQKHGNNTEVALFGTGEDGKQHPFLRGIIDREGNVRQQTDKSGKAVAFEGDWATKNSAEHALLSNGRNESKVRETQPAAGEVTEKSPDRQLSDLIRSAIRGISTAPAEQTSTTMSSEAPVALGSSSIEATTAPTETQEDASKSKLAADAGVNEAILNQAPEPANSKLADDAGINDIEKAAAPSATPLEPADKAATNVKVAEQQLETQTQKFETNVKDQGFMGKTFDFLKNNVGSSSENRAWYNPKALWSNLLDSDSGSDAIRTKLDGIKTMIASARTDVDSGNVDSSNKKIDALYTQGQNGSRVLQASNEVQKYDDSQRKGVDVMAGTAVTVGTVALASTGVGLVPILAGAAAGGAAKYLLKAADGNYASSSDLLTGAVIGAAPGLGRVAGAMVSDAAAWGGAKLGSAALSNVSTLVGFSTESGMIGGMTGAAHSYTDAREHGASVTEALGNAATGFGVGFGVGFGAGMVIGAPMQMLGKGRFASAVNEAGAERAGGYVPPTRQQTIKAIMEAPDPFTGKMLSQVERTAYIPPTREQTIRAIMEARDPYANRAIGQIAKTAEQTAHTSFLTDVQLFSKINAVLARYGQDAIKMP